MLPFLLGTNLATYNLRQSRKLPLYLLSCMLKVRYINVIIFLLLLLDFLHYRLLIIIFVMSLELNVFLSVQLVNYHAPYFLRNAYIRVKCYHSCAVCMVLFLLRWTECDFSLAFGWPYSSMIRSGIVFCIYSKRLLFPNGLPFK